jgi:hypothetical protein
MEAQKMGRYDHLLDLFSDESQNVSFLTISSQLLS